MNNKINYITKPVDNDSPVFRGYAMDFDKWVIGNMTNPEKGIFLTCIDENDNIQVFQCYKETVSEYAGCDKNGTRIFTGDVLKVFGLEILQYVYMVKGLNNITVCPIDYNEKGIPFEKVEKIQLDLEKMSSMIEVVDNIFDDNIPKVKQIYENNPDMRDKPLVSETVYVDEDGNVIEDDEECLPASLMKTYSSEELVSLMKDDHIFYFRAMGIDNKWKYGIPGQTEDSEEYVEAMKNYVDTKDSSALSAVTSTFLTMNDEKEFKTEEIFRETLCEWIGLFDKNDNQIYERDVVVIKSFSNIPLVVEYEEMFGTFAFIPMSMYFTDKANDVESWSGINYDKWREQKDSIEILGNIYDDSFLEQYDLNSMDMQMNMLLEDTFGIIRRYLHPSEFRMLGNYSITNTPGELSMNFTIHLINDFECRLIVRSAEDSCSLLFGKWSIRNQTVEPKHGILIKNKSLLSCLDKVNEIIDKAMAGNVNYLKRQLKKVDAIETSQIAYTDSDFTISDFCPVYNENDSYHKRNRLYRKAIKKIYGKNVWTSCVRAIDLFSKWHFGCLYDGKYNSERDTVLYKFKNNENPRKYISYVEESSTYNTLLLDKDNKWIYAKDIVDIKGYGVYVITLMPTKCFESVTEDTNIKEINYKFLYKSQPVFTKWEDFLATCDDPEGTPYMVVDMLLWHILQDRISVIGNLHEWNDSIEADEIRRMKKDATIAASKDIAKETGVIDDVDEISSEEENEDEENNLVNPYEYIKKTLEDNSDIMTSLDDLDKKLCSMYEELYGEPMPEDDNEIIDFENLEPIDEETVLKELDELEKGFLNMSALFDSEDDDSDDENPDD